MRRVGAGERTRPGKIAVLRNVAATAAFLDLIAATVRPASRNRILTCKHSSGRISD